MIKNFTAPNTVIEIPTKSMQRQKLKLSFCLGNATTIIFRIRTSFAAASVLFLFYEYDSRNKKLVKR